MLLPGGTRAVVSATKIRDYLLSNAHPVGRFKAALFARLGYTAANWQDLADVLVELAGSAEAEVGDVDEFGTRYTVRAKITGPSGGTAEFVTVWIVRTDEDVPRFVTAYPG